MNIFIRKSRKASVLKQRRASMRVPHRIAILATIAVSLVSTAVAQNQPATQPAAQRTARRGLSGEASPFPRERLPFTNGDLNAINPNLPTLFITGDSTAARNGNDIQRGWGAVLVDYFDTSKVNLVNYAQGGASFPSYYGSRWPQVVAAIKPGDFVVIEFGHNSGHLNGIGDESQTRAGRAGRAGRGPTSGPAGAAAAPATAPATAPSTTIYTYGGYIRRMAAEVRAKGGTPIVSTTTVRNMWSNPNATFKDAQFVTKNDNYNREQDKVERSMGQPLDNGMSLWAKQVAEAEKIPFVDHCEITAQLYEKIGREATDKLFIQDHTHTTTEGAIVNAETFIAGLKALPNMPLNNFYNDKGKAIPAFKAN
jgi:lysophospholipase L1-like esterase